jgi:Icc-related predicted phosphoesterase
MLRDLPPSIRVLDNTDAVIDGVRFLGGTMWFQCRPHAPTWMIADFQHIHGDFPTWVNEENARTEAYLRAQVRPGDVVVTHHLPSQKSISEAYAHDPTNVFFLHEMGDLIESAKPALWLHGHTHAPCDYALGETRVVCNPHGYLHESRAGFRPALTIGIDR